MKLAELQEYLLNAIVNEQPVLDNYVINHGIPCDRRLKIYRNNFITTLIESLNSLYPSILKLVGNDFFNGVAYNYILSYPSTSGNLHHYGQHFSDFLADFLPAKSLPYLPEIAQLEWGMHQVFHEAESEPLDIKKLAAIPQEHYSDLKFHLRSASRLYSFHFPVVHIWNICQQEIESDGTVDLGEGGVNLLLIRHNLEIEFEILSAGEYIFLNNLAKSKSFGVACQNALMIEPNFNISEALKKHILLSTFHDIF